ncbi:dTMP kinase [Acetobacteraceae bacterium]|nr:dTMP kinase [Acetobacteraceae bacterium]
MENKGLFLTFEGGEGAGKSTQTHLLNSWLTAKGYEVCLTREPGGTKGAELLRKLLLFSQPNFSVRAEIAVHFAARLDHIEQIILPALAAGKIVLCDRFYDSTWAYQGYGMKKGDAEILDFIENLHRLAPIKPQATFLLDIPVPRGMERARRRQNQQDRYEQEKEAFHQNVREGYLVQADKYPERISVIDALLPPEHIQADLQEKIEVFLQNLHYKFVNKKIIA